MRRRPAAGVPNESKVSKILTKRDPPQTAHRTAGNAKRSKTACGRGTRVSRELGRERQRPDPRTVEYTWGVTHTMASKQPADRPATTGPSHQPTDSAMIAPPSPTRPSTGVAIGGGSQMSPTSPMKKVSWHRVDYYEIAPLNVSKVSGSCHATPRHGPCASMGRCRAALCRAGSRAGSRTTPSRALCSV